MTAIDIVVMVLVVLGAAFNLLAAVGIVRMPDLYTRMQSATKAGTLGVACLVLAAAFHFRVALVAVEALLVIILLFVTAPIASHLIARAAYVIGVPMWSQTERDDLREQLDDPVARPDDDVAESVTTNHTTVVPERTTVD